MTSTRYRIMIIICTFVNCIILLFMQFDFDNLKRNDRDIFVRECGAVLFRYRTATEFDVVADANTLIAEIESDEAFFRARYLALQIICEPVRLAQVFERACGETCCRKPPSVRGAFQMMNCSKEDDDQMLKYLTAASTLDASTNVGNILRFSPFAACSSIDNIAKNMRWQPNTNRANDFRKLCNLEPQITIEMHNMQDCRRCRAHSNLRRHGDLSMTQHLFGIQIFFMFVFSLDILVKFFGFGHKAFFTRWQLVAELVLVLAGCIEAAYTNSSKVLIPSLLVLRIPFGLAEILEEEKTALRQSSRVEIFRNETRLIRQLYWLSRSIKIWLSSLGPLCLILAMFTFAFAAVGKCVFGPYQSSFMATDERLRMSDHKRGSWDNFLPSQSGYGSLLTVFMVLIGEDWDDVMHAAISHLGVGS